MPPPLGTQNYCKELEWKIPYTINAKDINASIRYNDCGNNLNGNGIIPAPEFTFNDCQERLNYETIYPLLFDELPDSDDSVGGYESLLYGYKNINHNEIYNLREEIQLYSIILEYNKIKRILFRNFNEQCIDICRRNNLSRHAHGSCCGFTAPIIACIYYFYKRFYEEHDPEDADIEKLICLAAVFYKDVSGYEGSENGVGMKCDGFDNMFAIKDGIFLVALYDRASRQPNPRTGQLMCETYHHFVLIKKGVYSILIDSWAGRGGFRREWIRIMKTQDILIICHIIRSTNDLYLSNRLLNMYFAIPHGLNNTFDYQPLLYDFGAIDLTNEKYNKETFWGPKIDECGGGTIPSQDWKAKYTGISPEYIVPMDTIGGKKYKKINKKKYRSKKSTKKNSTKKSSTKRRNSKKGTKKH
jgi:hypothetical protein